MMKSWALFLIKSQSPFESLRLEAGYIFSVDDVAETAESVELQVKEPDQNWDPYRLFAIAHARVSPQQHT